MKLYLVDRTRVLGCATFECCGFTVSVSNVFTHGEVAVFRGADPKPLRVFSGNHIDAVVAAARYCRRRQREGL